MGIVPFQMRDIGSIERRDGTKARLKPSKGNIKSCGLYLSSGACGIMMRTSINMGSPTPMAWPAAAHMASLLGLLYSLLAAFLGRLLQS
jgi:hypothetical protein